MSSGSKYGIGQAANWLRPNLYLIVGSLPEGEWHWTQGPLPRKAVYNLKEYGLVEQTSDGHWTLSDQAEEAILKMAEERGIDEEEMFADCENED